MYRAVTFWQRLSSLLRNLWRVLLLACLLGGCLSFTSLPAQAAHPGLTVTAHAGFGSEHYSKNNFWIPVYIQVDNEGASISGQIEAEFDSGNQHNVAAVTTTLGTHSSKSYVLYGVFSSVYNFNILIRVVDRGQIIYNEQLDTNGIYTLQNGDLLLGILSDNPLPFSFLSNMQTGTNSLRTATLTLDELPAQPLAMRNLDGLVISDATLSSIRPLQQQALLNWVNMGGLLIVTGGSVIAQQTIQSLPPGLLPVTVSGTETVDNLSALQKFLGHALPGSGPYVISTVKSTSGDNVIREVEDPLLVHVVRGAGTVFFLGLDPAQNPLNAWPDGNARLWSYLLDYLPQTPIIRTPQFTQNTTESTFLQAVNNIPATALPSSLALVILLTFYVLTVTFVNYVVLRLFDRREFAWVTIPVIALVFTGISFMLGFRAKGANVIINQISLIRASPGAASAPETTYLGFFSPQKTSYQISIGRDALISFPQERPGFGSPGLSSESLRWLQGNPTVLPNFLMDFSTLTTLRVDSVVQLKGQIAGVLSIQNGQIAGRLTNNTGYRFSNTYLILGHANTSLGDFAPGESKTVLLEPAISNEIFFSPSPSQSLDSNKNSILNNLFGSNSSDMNVTNHVMFVGWMEDNPISIKVKGYKPTQQVLTLYTSSIPLSFLTRNGNLNIPSGLILATQEGSSISPPGLLTNQPGSYLTYPGQNFVIGYQLPVSSAVLAHPVLEVTVIANSGTGLPSNLDPVELLLWNWQTSTWVAKKFHRGVTSIPNALPFISPSGHVRIRYINDQKSAVNFNPLTISVRAEVPQ